MNIDAVKRHWEKEACGTRYSSATDRKQWIKEIADARYLLAPYIPAFADFQSARGKKVLEIGVGAGVDFLNWIRAGAHATGIDLTEEAISLTRERLTAEGIDSKKYHLSVANAETLSFKDASFDLVYSWGVLHHTPDTKRALEEAFRVLAPGGELKIMLYHVPSWTGWMLLVHSALMRGTFYRSGREAIFNRLESPGTKAFGVNEARSLLQSCGFSEITTSTRLCAGDLLKITPSDRYQSRIYKVLWKLYPRWLVKGLGDRFGLELLIKAKKPLHS